jgi:hypothetical protein
MRRPAQLVIVALLAGAGSPAVANDSAAAIAAGGVILRDERRVSMNREQLTIRRLQEDSRGIPRFQVAVEYEFVNESAEDVTTEVAFPVPEYGYPGEALEGPVDLGGFRAWVDDKEIPVAKQVRALVGGTDQTAVLRELGIDVERHGNYELSPSRPPRHEDQIRKLTPAAAERLVKFGLLEAANPEPGWPMWKVAITWHWTQTFPAGRKVRVRHEYTPAAGFRYEVGVREFLGELPDACADDGLIRSLESRKRALAEEARRKGAHDRSMIFGEWVNYILTTANSWKTPIRDFELIVERPEGHAVSLCWDGKVERIGRTRFIAKAKNFVPAKELAVYFFHVR